MWRQKSCLEEQASQVASCDVWVIQAQIESGQHKRVLPIVASRWCSNKCPVHHVAWSQGNCQTCNGTAMIHIQLPSSVPYEHYVYEFEWVPSWGLSWHMGPILVWSCLMPAHFTKQWFGKQKCGHSIGWVPLRWSWRSPALTWCSPAPAGCCGGALHSKDHMASKKNIQRLASKHEHGAIACIHSHTCHKLPDLQLHFRSEPWCHRRWVSHWPLFSYACLKELLVKCPLSPW